MATEILRPNGAGSGAAIPDQYPDSGEHWDKVDEATPDEDATYVACGYKGGYPRDLYALPQHTGVGSISSVTVYCRGKCSNTPTRDSLRIYILTSGTEYYEAKTVTTGYAGYSKQWTASPYTGNSWTWDEIDALEAGVALRSGDADNYWATRCTQVWVVVDYSDVTPKTSLDVGSGVEGAPAPSASLSGSETGSSIEALAARLLASFDIGTGIEVSSLLHDLFRELFATELGEGLDLLVAKIEMPTKGGGMKLWT